MTAMPAVERMTAEEHPARPHDPRERGDELIGGLLVMDEPPLSHELVWSEILHELEILVFRRSPPDAPAFDVALKLTRSDRLTSPALHGLAPALDAPSGE
jgi:hypothetical protein